MTSLYTLTIDRLMNRWAERDVATDWDIRARARLGLTPSEDVNTDDVFIAAYPGSGVTWLRLLVAGIAYGLDLDRTPYAVISDLIPGRAAKYYQRVAHPMYFTGHYRPRLGLRRVIYLIRDGRDATLSNFHRLSLIPGREVTLEQLVTGGDTRAGTWHEHVEEWLANPFNADVLPIRYEDLKTDGVTELKRLSVFLGRDWDDAFLASLYEKASFARVAARVADEERASTGPGPWKRRPWRQPYELYLRRGEVGGHQDEMPVDMVGLFDLHAGPTLERCGYLRWGAVEPVEREAIPDAR